MPDREMDSCVMCGKCLPEWASCRRVGTAIFPTRMSRARHRRKQFDHAFCVPCREQVALFTFRVGNRSVEWDSMARDVIGKGRLPEGIYCGLCKHLAVCSDPEEPKRLYGYIAEAAFAGSSCIESKVIAFLCSYCCEQEWELRFPPDLKGEPICA